MSSETSIKTVGQAIDALINALKDIPTRDQLVAIRAACLSLDLEFTPPSGNKKPSGSSTYDDVSRNPAGPATVPQDIRNIKEQKKPSSAGEMACLVAHYLQTSAPADEQKMDIGADDLDKYFRQAGYPLPKAMSQVLPDAKSAGYFDSVGHGRYKLNPVGYNLIVHFAASRRRSWHS